MLLIILYFFFKSSIYFVYYYCCCTIYLCIYDMNMIGDHIMIIFILFNLYIFILLTCYLHLCYYMYCIYINYIYYLRNILFLMTLPTHENITIMCIRTTDGVLICWCVLYDFFSCWISFCYVYFSCNKCKKNFHSFIYKCLNVFNKI